MLLMPSWGGMINGLLTLRGAWDKVKEDAVLKFMVVAITAYGMATFEGPLLSLKSVNAVGHFTDWIIAHVHIGGLGWNGFLTFGVLYWLVPRIYNTSLYSKKLANAHFWIGTLGILFYAIPLYWAGFTQGLMWKQFTETGQLMYKFLETVDEIKYMYLMRGIGGLMYLSGAIIMVYNLVATARQGSFISDEAAEATPFDKTKKVKGKHWHSWIEIRPVYMLIFATVAILIGGIIEMVPTFLVESNVPTIASVQPYTPLELQGRDIYIREGCNVCHSQMVRPFRDETLRYKGEYSKPGEFVYDHPFLWGSKRTGPDLHRVGGQYSHKWHYVHMMEPRNTSPGSIMPPYPWLLEDDLDTTTTAAKITVMQQLGVPYPDGYEKLANTDLMNQANIIAADLAENDIRTDPNKEIIALIAYLQRLGSDINVKDEVLQTQNK
jgi:cytochrome c oxidase cbb3-type subunit I/II